MNATFSMLCDPQESRDVCRAPFSVSVGGARWIVTTNGAAILATPGKCARSVGRASAAIVESYLTDALKLATRRVRSARLAAWAGTVDLDPCGECRDGCDFCDGTGKKRPMRLAHTREGVLVNRWQVARVLDAANRVPPTVGLANLRDGDSLVVRGDPWIALVRACRWPDGALPAEEAP